MSRLPQPPISNNPQDIKQSLSDVIRFMRETYENGSKHQGFTQAQIDAFKDKSYLGTIVFNSDTNESNVAYLDGTEVKWRAF